MALVTRETVEISGDHDVNRSTAHGLSEATELLTFPELAGCMYLYEDVSFIE
mgnify:CR=1 FL=1